MRFNEATFGRRALGSLKAAKARIASGLQHLAAARKRRREHDEQFYRDLKAYCRAHNVSHICGDDWKTHC